MKWSSCVSDEELFTGDLDQVRKALETFIDPEHPFEIRSIFDGGGHPCVCRSIDDGLAAVQRASTAKAVFWILNPLQGNATSAKKSTVLCRRWFLIDVDAARPADTSSTAEEKSAAGGITIAILDYLNDRGWPTPVMTDSGNGFHLLYRIDLPNTPHTQQILKSALVALGNQFDCAAAHVDRSCHDAPRPCKLPGTWARKGANTQDRPHRLAKLIYIPETIEVVSSELLTALIAPPRNNLSSNTHGTLKWSDHAGNGRVLDHYVRSAIERECCAVALTTIGDRNNTLNRAAFNLGTMSSWPEMDEPATRATLLHAGQQAGLDPQECQRTIANGWEAGKGTPRERPGEPPNDHLMISPTRMVIFGNEVTPKTTTYLWDLRIAPGFISIFAGKTGIGKSFVLCDIAARLTTGRALPEQAVVPPACGVLFISEDPIEYVLVPRLIELGADLTRVCFMTWEAMAKFTLEDTAMLEEVYHQAKQPRLVIFDPPANFLGKKDEHKNAEVRSVVMRLVAWLDTHQVAAVFVTHVNKRIDKGLEALDRIMGSVAWGTTARIALGFASDPNSPDQCVCAGIKNNLGPKAPTLGFEIKKTDALATVEWKGLVDVSADDALGKVKKKSRVQNAAQWLTDRFRERRTWASEELFRLGRADGISRNAIFEAGGPHGTLPIRAEHVFPADGSKSFWEWSAHPGWPEEKNSGQLGQLGQLVRKSNADNTHGTVPIFDSSGTVWDSCCKESPTTVPTVPDEERIGTVPCVLSALDLHTTVPTVPTVPIIGKEKVRAIRFLSDMLTREPVSRISFHELGKRLQYDPEHIDQAAETLNVIRTIEGTQEMWSLP